MALSSGRHLERRNLSDTVAVQPLPEFEITTERASSVRYLEHGFPDPLVRWHYHNDYELHFIVASSGKLFVGDYIGRFEPGNLVLTGPRLPHNWISQIGPGQSVALRDMAVQFPQDLIGNMARYAPELDPLLPLLDRARYGVEFGGEAGRLAHDYMQRLRASDGPLRLGLLFEFLQILANESRYQLLSAAPMRSNADDAMLNKVDVITRYVTENYRASVSLSDVCKLIGMSESALSRFFCKATGNRFNEFLNRVRISKACELLAQTECPITTICFEVGFNNVANFNRRFRSVKHITPREYREQSRQRVAASAPSTAPVSALHSDTRSVS